MRRTILTLAALLAMAAPAAAQSGATSANGVEACQRAGLLEAAFTSNARRGGGFTYNVDLTNPGVAPVRYTLSFTASGLPNAVSNKQGAVGAGARVRHELAGGADNLTERTMRSLTWVRCSPL